jgi:predicted DsbA family dithiol-disulfide isomerase
LGILPVRVRYFTDPACSWSWNNEPVVRKLMVEFGGELSWSWVMGGLARDYTQGFSGGDAGAGGAEAVYAFLTRRWLQAAEWGRMPTDPLIWHEGPLSSSYPACMAVKAAAEQSRDDGGYRYLRALREGILSFRRKLDTTEALVEEARRVGLDVQRFRIDLGSHAIVEAFGADLDLTRDPPEEARRQGKVEQRQGGERLPFPSAVFIAEDGSEHGVFGPQSYEAYAAAAEAAGARRLGDEPPSPLEAIRRFGRMATVEVEAVCDLPTPRAAAHLWGLATDWKVKPVRVLTGYLWEPA